MHGKLRLVRIARNVLWLIIGIPVKKHYLRVGLRIVGVIRGRMAIWTVWQFTRAKHGTWNGVELRNVLKHDANESWITVKVDVGRLVVIVRSCTLW